MTIIQVDNAEAAASLVRHFSDQPDVAVAWAGPNRIRVSLLGSFGDQAMHLELILRLRAWQEAERARGRQATLTIRDE